MSRTGRDQRLHLFGLGNNRCPICLAFFTELDAEQGKAVTLEHVPPRSFKIGGFAMCLTCADCNNSASRSEKAAVEATRAPKVRIDIPGVPSHTAYLSATGGSPIDIRMSKLRVPQAVFDSALRSGKSFGMRVMGPTRHFASVPWLKAAYLSVFSLLGVHGHRYAEGKAIERVREQIMKPEKKAIGAFAVRAPTEWKQRDGMLMNRRQSPCWAVKMGKVLVLLPRGWDTAFYKWTDRWQSPGSPITLGGGPLWYPAKFGQNRVASIAFDEGYDPMEQIGEDLFGRPGRAVRGDQVTQFVFADYKGRNATTIITDPLEYDGGGASPALNADTRTTGHTG